MKRRWHYLILLLAGLQLMAAALVLALPSLAQSIPGRYRVALAERSPLLSEVTEQVIQWAAPAPELLPAPAVAQGEAVDVRAMLQETEPVASSTRAVLPSITPTATATAIPLPSATATGTASAQVNVLPTAAPPTAATDTPTPLPTNTPTPEPLPEQVIIEGITAVRQYFNNCGPANLTKLLTFYGLTINQTEIATVVKPNPEDRNVSPWQMVEYVNDHTPLQAGEYSNGTLDLLKELIAAGYPVIIEKGYWPNTEGATGWWGHYLTIFGYDDTAERFYNYDSYLGPFNGRPRLHSYDYIEQFWQQFNYNFIVIYPADQQERVQSILGPNLLDRERMWRDAAGRADEAVQADPDNLFAWFNLGTSLTRLGELTGEARYYQGGAQAFDEARTIGLPPRMLWYQHRPYSAYLKVGRYDDVMALTDTVLREQGGRNVEETYWYRGHALLSLGDVAAARAAYEQALVVNTNFYYAQWSLDYIDSLDE
jgi:tetratricopeptide (TPR) repeat protein